MSFIHVLRRKLVLVLVLLGPYKQQESKIFTVAIFHWKDVAERAENVKKEKRTNRKNTKK